MSAGLVVIGVGNPWRGDDAAGLEVAQRLEALRPDGMRIVQWEGDQARLLDAWEGADDVVVVDAASSGGPPGTVHRIDALAGPLPAALFRTSTHAFGVADAVELARALGRLPGRLVVYAVEGSDFTAGAGLTPAVEAAVDDLVGELAALRLSDRARS